MLETWELVAILILLPLFGLVLRAHFIRHFRTLSGAIIGAVLGRIAYVYVSHMFGFRSEIAKLAIVIIGAYYFAGMSQLFFEKVFPNRPENKQP